MREILLPTWKPCSRCDGEAELLGVDLVGVKGEASAWAWRAGFSCSSWQCGSDGGLDLEIFSVEGVDVADVEAVQSLPTEAVLLRVDLVGGKGEASAWAWRLGLAGRYLAVEEGYRRSSASSGRRRSSSCY